MKGLGQPARLPLEMTDSDWLWVAEFLGVMNVIGSETLFDHGDGLKQAHTDSLAFADFWCSSSD